MKAQISRQISRLKFPRWLPLLALPLLAAVLGLLAPGDGSPAEAATGGLAGSVTFSVNCESGIGVGIAHDRTNLWYSCFEYGTETSKLDLFRANPITGGVDASYDIVAGGGLGALSYDVTRHVIWAGAGGFGAGEPVYKIPLDPITNLVSGPAVLAFTVPGSCPLDDGLAFDARNLGDPSDDRLYYSNDCFTTTIRTFDLSGTLDESFLWGGAGCYNSGLAVGGSLLYQGSDGCSHVWVVDKTSKAAAFDFPTVVAGDPNFRDEDLECDAKTFAPKEVMWSKEAYNPMRAHAFEIPRGSCVTPGPDLTCTKELKPGVAAPQAGGTASYIIKCRNIGNQPTPAGIDVQLRDYLPAGSSLIFWTANGGTCSNSPPIVDCNRGRMVPGEEWWVEIKVKVPWRVVCSLINRVTIDPLNRIAETNEHNNTATLATPVGNDRCIDTDGTATAGDGFANPVTPGSVNVFFGAPLASFPEGPAHASGLDMFDNDGNGAWTFGPAGDDLHLEGTEFCPTAIRNGVHELGADCKVLDYNASLFSGQFVNCDLEFLLPDPVGGAPGSVCPTNVRYYDADGDGAYDNGEDLVVDTNGDGVFN